MYYVYVLGNRDKKLYIGFTSNLEKRFQEHNRGESRATKPYIPWKIIFYEAYLNKYDALRRERYFKTSKGRKSFKLMLKEYFN